MDLPALPEDCASRFRPVRMLGTGGYGAVYLAEQIALGRKAAVKVLRTDRDLGPTDVARFKEEARISASLSHPNIVRVFDFGCGASDPWIAFEFVSGPSLERRLEDGPLGIAEVIQVGLQAGRALQAAHAIGVVHRDLKPANILQSEGSTYKLADFGVAKWSRDCAIVTRTGIVVGTPAYLSPDYMRTGESSPGSDLYSLGVTLYELLTGRLPFDGDVAQVLRHHLDTTARRVSKLVPDCPPALDEIVTRLLAKTPEERYESAGSFLQALESSIPRSARSATGKHRLRRSVSLAIEVLPDRASSERAATSRRAVGLILAALAAAWLVTASGRRTPPGIVSPRAHPPTVAHSSPQAALTSSAHATASVPEQLARAIRQRDEAQSVVDRLVAGGKDALALKAMARSLDELKGAVDVWRRTGRSHLGLRLLAARAWLMARSLRNLDDGGESRRLGRTLLSLVEAPSGALDTVFAEYGARLGRTTASSQLSPEILPLHLAVAESCLEILNRTFEPPEIRRELETLKSIEGLLHCAQNSYESAVLHSSLGIGTPRIERELSREMVRLIDDLLETPVASGRSPPSSANELFLKILDRVVARYLKCGDPGLKRLLLSRIDRALPRVDLCSLEPVAREERRRGFLANLSGRSEPRPPELERLRRVVERPCGPDAPVNRGSPAGGR